MLPLLCTLLVTLLSTSCSPASLSPELKGFDASDDGLTGETVSGKDCQQDEECCSGLVCAWGRCTEGLGAGSNGTRCDLTEDRCVSGLCCSQTRALPFPVCAPFPSEGDQCYAGKLFILINVGVEYGPAPGNCPCAEGLVCTSKGNPISTCEKPDDVLDFANYRGDTLLPPLVRREEELAFYDSDLIPWPDQDEQLTFIDFPRAAEENEKDAKNTLKMPGVVQGDNLDYENLHFDNHLDKPADPSQTDFQELKQLASEMGQYFGPGLY